MQALSRRIEGTCTVEYTVTTTGTTKDIRVLEDWCPDRVFHSVSIEAAKKFKYKPRVVDGVAIEVPGVKNMFIFELNED
ncbi:MAG: TonB family protein, partial [Gammaproteobacteria bacterium]|nr:TonB family protein [Gammaproteobacteria bacterium]